MGSNESRKHGKYCFVYSRLIMEYGRMGVNNQKFLLGEFPHYEGLKTIKCIKQKIGENIIIEKYN